MLSRPGIASHENVMLRAAAQLVILFAVVVLREPLSVGAFSMHAG